MSIKIGVLSQKGGTGKSTLCRALAVSFGQMDWQVKIADMDLKQKTILEWNALRLENEYKPAVETQSFSSTKSVLKQEHLYDLIIFDGAGQADGKTLEIAKICDVVLLPSGCSRDDLIPQMRLAREMTSKGIHKSKIGFSLSRVGRSEREIQDAVEFIEEFNFKYLGLIPEKTSIAQAHDVGLSAIETKYDTISNVIDALIQNIILLVEENQSVNA